MSDVKGTITGFWEDHRAPYEVSMTIQPIARWRKVGCAFVGPGRVVETGEATPFKVFFPTRDRRIARRTARKLGVKFTKTDGWYNF